MSRGLDNRDACGAFVVRTSGNRLVPWLSVPSRVSGETRPFLLHVGVDSVSFFKRATSASDSLNSPEHWGTIRSPNSFRKCGAIMIFKREALGRKRPGEFVNKEEYNSRIAPLVLGIGLEGFAAVILVLVIVCLR
jgi:hypothetical protein